MKPTEITPHPEGTSERPAPTPSNEPAVAQTIDDTRSTFAGWSEGCSCGRIHEKWVNPKTGEVSIDTGWY